jgi:hypothetical protein
VADMSADPTLDLVRAQVRGVLENTRAYRALDAEDRRELAHNMVTVARYMVDAGGETAGTPMRATVAAPYADAPVAALADDRAGAHGTDDTRTAGSKFADSGAVAAQQGSRAFTGMIQQVNFPKFVAGLVQGVFNAIVDSSIKQMEAYGTLLKNVAKSVDEYMKDNVTTNQARDYLASKYPRHMEVDTKGKDPQLVPKRDAPHGDMPDFMKDLGLDSMMGSLTKKNIEDKLVPAARRRMAMDRQQLLATMVLMGINRLIVTDGKISAHCLFQLDTTDSVDTSQSYASEYDQQEHTEEEAWHFLWFSGGQDRKSDVHFNVKTTNDTDSSADVQMHAELSGEVNINFKSETFPLEKMADLIQIKQIEEKAPAAAAVTPPVPGAPLPPPPALPALPGMPGAQQPLPQPAPAQQPAPAPVGG